MGIFLRFAVSYFKHLKVESKNCARIFCSALLKSQLKLFCLGQKKSFEVVFRGLGILNFSLLPNHEGDSVSTVLS